MEKSKINTKFSDFAKTLSPKDYEKKLVQDVYQAVNNLLGVNNCIQIGSYPRFTSITPVHDLDVLYILGKWNPNSHNPDESLNNLHKLLINDFENPTEYKVKISKQTHSITLSFQENDEEMFGLDIVPAYIFGKNEFELDIYKVPEIINLGHNSRVKKYETITKNHTEMSWIDSDPRGYIEIAKTLDISTNGNFRKAVKLLKHWKNNLCEVDENLKLRSFHIEQVITQYFVDNKETTIFDAVFKFFTELFETISAPNQIQDRANSDKYIDDYLEKITPEQKNKIMKAGYFFLGSLENIKSETDVSDLFIIRFHSRKVGEQFLFDYKIPTLLDSEYDFNIHGVVLQGNGFQGGILPSNGSILVDRKIRFGITGTPPNVHLFKWKVKNDDNCDEPRGEISNHSTANVPEHTAFSGTHYVECYAILDNVCVAKSRQYVVLNRLN